MVKKFDNDRYANHAQETTDRASLFQSQIGRASKVTAENCPLIWDTGASFVLTPFRQDFIEYVECKIQVKDISKTNTVVGIGLRYTSSTWMESRCSYRVSLIICQKLRSVCSAHKCITHSTVVTVLCQVTM